MATLVVQADAPCTLFVNGREAAQLPKGITEVKVSPGQSLVSCSSSEEKVAVFEGELEAKSGQNSVLRISLAARVADIRSTRAAALEREAQVRREAEAREAQVRREAQAREEARVAEARRRADAAAAQAAAEAKAACERREPGVMQRGASSGVLRHCGTGLEWAARDSERPVDWWEAQSFCRELGSGWRLPSDKQLRSLQGHYPKSPCPGQSGECAVSNLFQLSGTWFWSSRPVRDEKGNFLGQAYVIPTHYGGMGEAHVDVRYPRALCIRTDGGREADEADRGITQLAAQETAACERGELSSMQSGSGSGRLRQCATGLEWTGRDNDGDVDWVEAQAYCRGLGEGWGLPTADQLLSLRDEKLRPNRCGTIIHDNGCRVNSRFRLSTGRFWSSERNGPAQAWRVDLYDGGRFSFPIEFRGHMRALCVRRP